MALLALIVYAVWLLLGFGVRTLVQLCRTGDTGFRGAGHRPGSPQWWAGLLFVAALATGLAAPVAGLAGLDPFDPADRPVVHAAGVALAGFGVLATLGTQLAMGDAWRTGVEERERTTLVTGGPFRLVRNPIFTAMASTALGLALMVANTVAVAGLAALVIALEPQVRVVEEPYLQRVHGAAYQRYAATVGRFVPGVGRLSNRASW